MRTFNYNRTTNFTDLSEKNTLFVQNPFEGLQDLYLEAKSNFFFKVRVEYQVSAKFIHNV